MQGNSVSPLIVYLVFDSSSSEIIVYEDRPWAFVIKPVPDGVAPP
jgi:hypothetical protein